MRVSRPRFNEYTLLFASKKIVMSKLITGLIKYVNSVLSLSLFLQLVNGHDKYPGDPG